MEVTYIREGVEQRRQAEGGTMEGETKVMSELELLLLIYTKDTSD